MFGFHAPGRYWHAGGMAKLRQEVDVQFAKNQLTMRRTVACAVLAAGLLAAGCGGSSKHASTTQPAGTATTPPPTGTTAPAASTPAVTTPATPTTAAVPPCVAADLSLSFLGGQGATGHGELGFALRNTSAAGCSTYGYPGVLFLDRSGKALPTDPTHTTHDFFGTVPEALLTVAPGQTVSFRLGVTHGINSTAGCATASALQVIAPNDTATLRTAIGNGGAFECRTVTVSPLAPGTSAYP
jgi:Protein of unknown function (DUF4232)